MVDLTTITTALSGIKTATEIAQFLNNTDSSLGKAETKLKIAELINQLADAKIAIADIKEIIIEKDRQISELAESQKIHGEVSYEAPYYWHTHDGKKDGPYCQQCYDTGKKLIRLQSPLGGGHWVCQTCKSTFIDNNASDEPGYFG